MILSVIKLEPISTSRNLALSLAAGNATLWKPSPTTPLCSIAVTKIVSSVLERNDIPGAVAGLVIGGKDVGGAVVESHDVDLGKDICYTKFISLIVVRVVSFIYRQRSCWSCSREDCANSIRESAIRIGWKQRYSSAITLSSQR